MENIENINFGQFRALQIMMSQTTFDRAKQKELDFTSKEYTDTPPGRALKLLPNLRIINLSHNQIDRFNPENLIKYTPLLEELSLSHNNIKTMEDLVELGSLKQLKKLNILENPITRRLIRVRIVEFLLFPKKYQPYDPVKILTAEYTYIPSDPKSNRKYMEDIVQFHRIVERETEEIDRRELEPYRDPNLAHKDALAKNTLRPCPVPRKTRFPRLETLNEEVITIREIQSILTSDDLEAVLPSAGDKKGGKPERVNEKLHENYLKKYVKRQNRKHDELGIKRSEFVPLGEKDEAKEMQNLYKLDQAEIRTRIKQKEIEEKFWQRPVDLQFRETEYNISIKDHKKMLKDYEEYKKKLKAEKAQKKRMYVEKVRAASMRHKEKKKGGNKDKEEGKDISSESLDADREIKKLFGVKSKHKAKFNLDLGEDIAIFDSDESSLEEGDAEDNSYSSFTRMAADRRFRLEDMPVSMQGTGLSPTRGKKDSSNRSIELKGLIASLRVKEVDDESEMASQDRNLVDTVSQAQTPTKLLPKKPSKRAEIFKSFDSKKTGEKGQPQSAREPRAFFITNNSEPNLGLPLYPRLNTRRETVEEKGEEEKIVVEDQEQEDGTQKSSSFTKKKSEDCSRKSSDIPDVEAKQEQSDQPNSADEPANEEEYMQDNVIEDELQEQEEAKSKKSSNQRIESGEIDGYFSAPVHVETEKPYSRSDELKIPGMVESIVHTNNTKMSYLSPDSKLATVGETDYSIQGVGTLGTQGSEGNTGGSNKTKALFRSNTLGKNLRINSNLEKQPSSARTNPQSARFGKSSTKETPMAQTPRVPKIANLGMLTISPPSSLTSRQLSLRSTVQKARQHEKKTWSISNKIFAKHNDEPRTFITLPAKPMGTQRPTYQPPGSKRHGSVQWTQWGSTAGSTAGSPQKLTINKENTNTDRQFLTPTNNIRALYTPGSQSARLSVQGMPSSVGDTGHVATPSIILAKRTSLARETSDKILEPAIVIHKPVENESKKMIRRGTKHHSSKIIITEPLDLVQVLSPERRVNIENLVPQPKEGISEKQKIAILKDKNGNYARLVETAKMLDETTLLIDQANQINERVHMATGHKRFVSFPEKIIGYDQIAEFLRQFNKKPKLEFKDNMDIRELIYMVNDFDKLGEEKLNKVVIEAKLRELKQKGIGLEGKALDQNNKDIAKLDQHLEIIESLEAIRDRGKTAKALERIELKEIERAESNAILAAHYMKLRKHYGELFVKKYFKETSEVLENMEANRPGGFKVDFAHKVQKTVSSSARAYNMGFLNQGDGNKPVEEEVGSDWEELKELKEEKEPRWLSYTRVEKYEHKPMYTFEELTEMLIRKKEDEMNKRGQRYLTVEEKMIKYVQDLKDNAKRRKDLKARVEKQIKKGRKDIDEFLEYHRKENPKTYDKNLCFREYVRLIWENKI